MVAVAAVAVAAVLAAPAGAQTSVIPAFTNYTPPAGMYNNGGEPSIGVNWKTGSVFYQAVTHTLRVTFDDSTAPAAATWTDVSPLLTSIETLDPILFTDSSTGRTFVSQLTGACSLTAFTDDDGASWVQNPVGCAPGAAVDHQTVGGGPFAAPIPTGVGYAHSVYYCAQALVSAQCGVSLDGGITFDPGVPIYTLLDCGGLHGHLKVAPDGTAYVPNQACGGKQGVALTEDNGLTWSVRTVPDSTENNAQSDPSVGTASDGTVYFGYENGDGTAKIAVSHDKGLTWSASVDVGAPLGIVNSKMQAVVAGDGNRAAYAFLGSATEGDPTNTGYKGVWHLYVAFTYDGGLTWSTVDATPTDPVQRGCIDFGGVCRNLLDFMDVTVDKQGRVVVGYADGCINACVTGTVQRSNLATIARQSGGEGLFADPTAPR